MITIKKKECKLCKEYLTFDRSTISVMLYSNCKHSIIPSHDKAIDLQRKPVTLYLQLCLAPASTSKLQNFVEAIVLLRSKQPSAYPKHTTGRTST